MSLCERLCLTLGKCKKSSGNHNLPPVFVCLFGNSQTTEPVFKREDQESVERESWEVGVR